MVEIVHRLASQVLTRAVKDGIIDSNAARYARPPRAVRKQPRILTVAEVGKIALAVSHALWAVMDLND